jgi:hypothetical protein
LKKTYKGRAVAQRAAAEKKKGGKKPFAKKAKKSFNKR